ncbi:hypothetical protein COCCU_01505 [Corynebacterium occultum]|uniref:Chromosome partition protein Smc n=1 Tax=Corynebacterium occultum TaxID=2675219 RepID=A0A6B8VLD7_9CORY|nr:YhgE/Pip domain-containing protein [Corynebacterium occultum]QGU06262.1 hypothetical protein COCCU_01505 [Corynebacterium occultum]
MSSLRSRLLSLLVLLPLIIGAVYLAIAGIGPDRSWSAAEESTGAPIEGGPTGIDPAALVDARRAASEAGAQAGFLASGTGELTAGTGALREGADELGGAMEEAKSGAQELSNGLVQLQAATGQLGNGATQVADGVSLAIEQLTGLSAIQMQLIQAIEGINAELEKSDVPEARQIREQLTGFRAQVEAFPLTGENADQLNQLREGARDIANQLAVPGYGFHDGIYSATDGARRLNEGLGQLQGGVGEAVDGVSQLDEGAQKIDQMAGTTQDKLSNVQRSLPVTPAAGAEGTAAEGQVVASAAGDVEGYLVPLYALFIGALSTLGGIAISYLGRGIGRRLDRILGGIGVVALGTVLYILAAQGLNPLRLGAAIAVLALMTAASAGLALVVRRVVGERPGGLLAMVGAIIQVGLVGWVWKSSAGTEVAAIWEIVASLTPLHYATAALTVSGNAGDPLLFWVSGAVLGGVALLTGLLQLGGRKRAGAR